MTVRLDRRSALKLGVGAMAAAMVGCGTSPDRRSSPTTSIANDTVATTAPSAPTTAAAAPTQWSQLASSLRGRLVRPGDRSYLSDLQIYDSRFDSVRPQGIAYCATTSDVQRCVAFASEHQLAFTARCGGHSYGGYSTSPGLVIDVTAMNQVTVGADGVTATIGAGARLIDIYSALNPAGISIPGGSCPTVGIAGLTLGGGQGVVDRAHGLTCDALASVTLVTADGRVVDADAGLNPDLFWASRGGGGGNFGIATSFVFSTFATSPVTLASFSWPWEAAAEVLPAWITWASSAPDQMWSNCLLQTSAGAPVPTLSIGTVWIGNPAGVSGPLGTLRAAIGSSPSTSYIETVPFSHAMFVEGGCARLSQAACHLPSQNPQGALSRQPSLAKSAYISRAPSAEGVGAFISGIDARHAEGANGAAGFDACGGAINRVDAQATAFVHRSAMVSVQLNVPFDASTSEAVLAAGETWLDGWYGSLQPYFDGQAYQNYIDPQLADWASAYYGANLARLSQIKRSWDPDGLFRFAQSIPS